MNQTTQTAAYSWSHRPGAGDHAINLQRNGTYFGVLRRMGGRFDCVLADDRATVSYRTATAAVAAMGRILGDTLPTPPKFR